MNDTIDFQIVTENVVSVMEPHARVAEYISPSWNFIIVFLAMLMIVFNKQLFTQRFRMMLAVFYQPSDFDKMSREWNPVMSVNGLSIFITYTALLGLIVQKIVVVFSGNTMLYGGWSFYVDVCVFIAMLLIVQYLFINLYGWLFSFEGAASHHEVTHLSCMTWLNIMMIVFGLIILFYPTKIILIITISILLIIIGIRIIKTFFEFQILSKMNLFNIFLYLCTLEIIPLSVAVTMLRRLIVTNCVL